MDYDIDKIAELVAKHGFPIVSAIGMAWFVYYVWVWATTDIKPKLTQTHTSVIDLLDRIRKLDLDICRLHEKVDVAIQFRHKYEPRQPDNQDSEKSN
jgi:hypothetical protein